MKRILYAVLFVCVAARVMHAQDPLKVAPEHYKVEIENDQVRVLREKGGPRDLTPMHEHPANVVVYLTDGTARTTQPDGTVTDKPRKAGQAAWNDAQKHSRLNLLDKPYELIQVELKQKMAAAPHTPVALDAVKLDPKSYKIEFENDRVRVVRATRAPHSKVPMHEHPAYVAVYLTDVHQRTTDAEGKLSEVFRKAGEVTYNKPLKHAEENLSDQPFEAVLVELK